MWQIIKAPLSCCEFRIAFLLIALECIHQNINRKIFKMKQSLTTLHNEHSEWMNKLLFYEDELNEMLRRLSEIADKNTKTEVMARLEHFQNLMIVQKEQLDILKHGIRTHEQQLAGEVHRWPVASDHRKFPDHEEQRERMLRYEQLFEELRTDFKGFLSEWM